MKIQMLLIFFLLTGYAGNAQSNRIYTRQYRDSVLETYIGTSYVAYNLQLSDGGTASNEREQGKVVLFSFWFGGCPACLEEFNALNELYDSLKDNPSFRFISVACEPKERLPELIKKYNIHYPVAAVTGAECSRLNYHSGFPTNIIIDKNGKITVFKMEGYSEARARKVMIEEWLPKIKAMMLPHL
jgi:cytochrome oxidase Cu insertion factor (SCO1/SenC/PrrC family)